jgi:hypothetical protein
MSESLADLERATNALNLLIAQANEALRLADAWAGVPGEGAKADYYARQAVALNLQLPPLAQRVAAISAFLDGCEGQIIAASTRIAQLAADEAATRERVDFWQARNDAWRAEGERRRLSNLSSEKAHVAANMAAWVHARLRGYFSLGKAG